MKHRIAFMGRNASGFVAYGGVKFPCGEVVTVATGSEPGQLTQSWLQRLENHPEFEVKVVNSPGPKPAVEHKE